MSELFAGYGGDFEMSNYLKHKPGMAAVPWAVFDTQLYFSGATDRIEFFGGPRPAMDPGWTNLYFPHVLPEPQAFLVRKILLFGITSDLVFGEFRFDVGNRMFAKNPAWLHSIRPTWNFECGIFIPPMLHFRAELEWQAPQSLGAGLSGKPKRAAALQCVLLGLLARPIQ